MDSFVMIWFCFSVALFLAGVFIYRRGVELRIAVATGVNSVDAPVSLAPQEDEFAKLKEFYQDSLNKTDELIREKDVLIRQLEEDLTLKDVHLRELLEAREDVVGLMKAEQERLVSQLAEEKKYSAQSLDDYRSQIRSLDQMLSQLKEDHQISLREKDISFSRVLEERDIIVAQRDQLSQKILDLEVQLQEALKTLEAFKYDSAERVTGHGEDQKNALQKSIVLIKELKFDNDQFQLINGELKTRLLDLESANQSLEEKNQQSQYEVVKLRAQLLGFEQICGDLKKKIEQLASVKK